MRGLLVLFIGNDTVLELTGLTEVITETIESDAAISVTIYDNEAVAVAGQTWPATLDPVVGTAGAYRAALSADLELTPGATYTAEIDVETAGGVRARWDAPLLAKPRIN